MSHSSNIDIVGILYIYHIYSLHILFLSKSVGMFCFVLEMYLWGIYYVNSLFIQALGVFVKTLPGKLGEGDKAQAGEASKNNSQFAILSGKAFCEIFALEIFCLEKDWKHRKFFLSSVTDRPLRNLPATWPASVLALLVLLVLWSIGCIGCIQWTFPTFPGLAFCRPRHETAKLEVDSGKIWQNMTIMTKSSAFSTQKKLEKKKRWVHVFFYLNDRKSPISFHSMPDVRAASRYLHLGA